MSFKFGQPDPKILKSPGDFAFKDFTFNSIGKEPELLKRISSREEGVHYGYSPSPEPEYPPTRNEPEARTRPSLLQALTNQSQSQESQGYSTTFRSSQQPISVPLNSTLNSTNVVSPLMDDDSMQLQYPQTPVADVLAGATTHNPARPPSPPPPPPFVPDYPALKELHTRLEASHKVLALPPPPKKTPAPGPEFPRPSLIAANNAVHHTEKTLASAKEALQASQIRASISEQSVAAAQTSVDILAQALQAARVALEVAQKSLVEARQAAEEAQAALMASRAAADAAEETKRLLEEPPPLRAPTPEPVNPNAQIIGQMKKDLDTLRLWAEEQETGHFPAAVERDSSREREEEEEREASNMMIAPDENDTDIEAREANDTSAALEIPNVESGEVDVEIDEPRRSEEDAAQALVELAEQKISSQEEERQARQSSPMKGSAGKGNMESLTASAQALPLDATLQESDSLAREAALRKLQEAKREQVRIQKEQAQAAAASMILKERQDAAAKNSAAQSSSPLSETDGRSQSANGVARPVILPPSTGEVKVKAKKSKPISGGVKLGPEFTVKAEPSVPSDPSPAVERAAALGLRVRPSLSTQSAPSSKAGPPKKMRNQSLPPISHLSPKSPDEIFATRTGPDKGDIQIIQPNRAPKLPLDLSTDVQLLNLRFALQDEGIPWEAISRSRPKLSVKTEAADETLPPPSQAKIIPLATPTTRAPIAAPVATLSPLKPLPSRKQYPKFQKKPTDDGQTSQAVAGSSAEPSQPSSRPAEDSAAQSRPAEAPPIRVHPKWSPPPPVPVASTPNNPSVDSNTSVPTWPAPERPSSGLSNPHSGMTTPVPDTNGASSYRPLSERMWRPPGRSPSPAHGDFYNRSPPSRPRSPDGYRGRAGGSFNEEPERLSRRSRSPDWRPRPRSPTWTRYASPPSQFRCYTPPQPTHQSPSPARYTPPRSYFPPRAATPPPSYQAQGQKRSFSGDHYSPGPRRPSSGASLRRNSPPPPRGPRQGVPRAPLPQKRPREDDYTPPTHPQKRFKDDGRDAGRAPVRAASPPRQWVPREPDNERPALELRLGAPSEPNVHFVGRGESYRPEPDMGGSEEYWEAPKDGLLSRLSDPSRGTARGRGGARGRANNRARGGRGRGERSLVDRMV
ncbi:hypothetical protein DFH07DRAFT_369448 [Mycena maculata]|uniref:Uncharacterized protein n=1 Tax=Mycena maculata TaxID=230809 RepID=A0AAD7NKW3_9AGAR|nr:hypothetical protein DFH07DRAFT_369448 [Mycena maculata]